MPDSARVPAAVLARPVTAAAAPFTPAQFREQQAFMQMSWQLEAWGFRRTLGEYSQAIDWASRAESRIRLGAAEIVPGGDEPEMLTDGPAAMLMQDFCGGGPGQSAFLKAITPQLLVPGEGWLIAERAYSDIPLASADWSVFPTDCVRVGGKFGFQLRVGNSLWRDVLPDFLPIRVYDKDPQYPWLATSNSEAAIPIMRRIFLIDSRIVAMMVSRLAMNGLLLIPEEGTLSVPAQYQQAPDPFVAMLIDIASRNIQNPGSASAGIPIPIRFTGELIEKWKILKADDPLPEELIQEREAELGRLADTLAMARERVSGGMGKQNHWGQWQASEEEIKLFFSPLSELICGAVTSGYLRPMLVASGQQLVGPNGGRIVTWYDLSELASRPDKSSATKDAYDRLEANGAALRRESGLDESDKPDPAELAEMIWKKAITSANSDLDTTAVGKLTGTEIAPPAAPAPVAGPGAQAAGPSSTSGPATGPPAARPTTPPGPDDGTTAGRQPGQLRSIAAAGSRRR
jgi:hypothetical protein